MKEKISKIKKSQFSNEWTNPSGGTTYYFDVVMENGESGSIGTTDMNSNKVIVGAELNYSIVNNKIKVSPMPNSTPKSNYNSQSSAGYKKHPKQESFLGYSWSYAKDIIVAGKGMKDVEELNEVAKYIYNQIGEMLNNSK